MQNFSLSDYIPLHTKSTKFSRTRKILEKKIYRVSRSLSRLNDNILFAILKNYVRIKLILSQYSCRFIPCIDFHILLYHNRESWDIFFTTIDETEKPRPSFYRPVLDRVPRPITEQRRRVTSVPLQHAGRQPGQTTRSSLSSRWLPLPTRDTHSPEASPADIVNFLSQEFPIDPCTLPALPPKNSVSSACSTFCTRFLPPPSPSSPIDPFIPSWITLF